MKRQVRWSKDAIADLDEQIEYICKKSPIDSLFIIIAAAFYKHARRIFADTQSCDMFRR